MKKIFLVLMITMLFLISACSSTQSNEEEEVLRNDTPITGNIEIYDSSEVLIPEEAKEAFDSAVDEGGFSGTGLEAIALLGTQTVAGTNYIYLVRKTTLTSDPVYSYALLSVYVDTEGNATANDLRDLVVDDITITTDTDLCGGWSMVTEDVEIDYEKVFEGFTGVGYKPIAVLASQVVAGTNYLVLSLGTTVTAQPDTSLYVLKIYKDLSGNYEILDILDFDLAQALED